MHLPSLMKTPAVKKTKLLVLNSCFGTRVRGEKIDDPNRVWTPTCPFVKEERTRGAGYAVDYFCTADRKEFPNGRKITGYIEWPSELPKANEFPDWCPLYDCEPGMYGTDKDS